MLIGLNGRKQAGKDTVFARASQMFDNVERRSFADLLYRSAAASLGVTVEQLQRMKAYDSATVEVYLGFDVVSSQTVRQYLQKYGTEAHREVFGSDFWVDQVDLSHAGGIVMVTDVRFPNEARAIRAAGGVVVRIVGPDEVEGAGDGHASEAPLPADLVDHEILNRQRGDGFVSLDWSVANLVRKLRCECGCGGCARKSFDDMRSY